MEDADKKILSAAKEKLVNIEAIIIKMIKTLNDNGYINDADLCFLVEMLRLTRTYSNLLDELQKINEESD